MKFKLFSMIFSVLLISSTQAQENNDAPQKPNQKTYDLSLNDAIQLALDHNLDVKISRYDPQTAEADIEIQKSVFDWLFYFDITQAGSRSKSALSDDYNNSHSFLYDFGVNKFFKFGTNININTSLSRQSTDYSSSSYNPSYSADVYLTLTQPLLKNFGVEYNTAGITMAKYGKDIANEQTKSQIINTIYQVQTAYWNLVYSYENLLVKEHAKKLAQDTLNRTTTMVDKGVLPKVEITGAKAKVALTDFEIIIAKKQVGDAEDILKTLINLGNGKLGWDTKIKPIDQPKAENVKFKIGDIINKAFDNRPDIKIMNISMKTKDIDVMLAENDLKPVLNAFFKLGPTALRKDYPEVYGKLNGKTFDYQVGIEFELPIGFRDGKNSKIKAILEKKKVSDQLDLLKLEITRQVYSATRAIQSALDGIKAAEEAVSLGHERLDVEEQKRNQGLSTNINVIQVQDDLIKAEAQKIRALVDFKLAISELELISAIAHEKYNINSKEEKKEEKKNNSK